MLCIVSGSGAFWHSFVLNIFIYIQTVTGVFQTVVSFFCCYRLSFVCHLNGAASVSITF